MREKEKEKERGGGDGKCKEGRGGKNIFENGPKKKSENYEKMLFCSLTKNKKKGENTK